MQTLSYCTAPQGSAISFTQNDQIFHVRRNPISDHSTSRNTIVNPNAQTQGPRAVDLTSNLCHRDLYIYLLIGSLNSKMKLVEKKNSVSQVTGGHYLWRLMPLRPTSYPLTSGHDRHKYIT